MTEKSDAASSAPDDLNESITDVKYKFCKEWVEKQNSEGSKKLSQQNKNDIQFIIQTNADRKKFLLSAAEDEATVPDGIGEPSIAPKAVKLQQLRKEVRMECGWTACCQAFEDYREFQTHCRNHISDLQVTEEDGKIVYTCLWEACKHKNSDFDEICRHMNYHAYHARLLGIGFNARATLNLTRCKKDSTNRNKLPVFETDHFCLWVGCEQKFKSVQAFLDHVQLHVYYASPRYACSWAGCGAAFGRRTLLTTHLRSHTGERIIACYHCGHHFSSNRKIIDHLRRQNVPPSNENTCQICGFSYATEYLLRQHDRQHISQHACTLCDMSAPTLATLAQHVRYRHLHEHCRTHACRQCKHKAITKSDLCKHMRTHAKKRKTDSDISEEDSDGEPRSEKKKSRKYVCHMCPEKQMKVFARGNKLTTHLVKVHGVQWPFGHSRFRYQISEDGTYRLTTTRYEFLEVSKKIVDGYSGPKESLSNSFEFNLEQKAKATATTPTSFEITLKNDEIKKEIKLDENTVEITMCDVDEAGNIISSEVIKSDVVYSDGLSIKNETK